MRKRGRGDRKRTRRDVEDYSHSLESPYRIGLPAVGDVSGSIAALVLDFDKVYSTGAGHGLVLIGGRGSELRWGMRPSHVEIRDKL